MNRAEQLARLLENIEDAETWPFFELDPPEDAINDRWADAFNGSVDAARKVMLANAPGWRVGEIEEQRGGEWYVFLIPPDEKRTGARTAYASSYGPDLGRTWLQAVVQAMINEEMRP